MEKVPNRYAAIIRIICYILIPVFVLTIIQSLITLYYFDGQIQETNKKGFYETERFSDLYKTSICNNVEECYQYNNVNLGYEADISNFYDVAQLNTENGTIYYKTYLQEKNFKFLIIDEKTNKAFTNLEETTRTDTIEKIKQELSNYSYYWNYENSQIKTNINNLSLENMKYEYTYKNIEENYKCKIYTAIETPLKYNDNYYTLRCIYNIVSDSPQMAVINLIFCIILIFVCVIIITILAGRKKGQTQTCLDIVDKIPLEIVLIFIISILIFTFVLCTELYQMNFITFIIMSIIACILYIIGLAAYETLVKRIKTHTLLKNTIIYRIIKFLVKIAKTIFDHFDIASKIAIIIAAFGIITAILAHCEFMGFLILLIIYIAIFKISFSYARQIQNIKEITKQIYEGNTDIRLEEDEYKGVLKELCTYINDIAGGFTNAIEEGIKSERMKTELITNVSHDIKTPLTSIINYVDLLKKEEMPNEKAKEYLEILDQKSQRLKRLTEDLVEASKASSGNIKLNMEKLDVKELIKQVSGEFEDKLKEKKLELITSMPEEETNIIADSRYLYRVIENMYSNIVKYAMPDSRVYIDIISDKEDVKIELKNISKEKLNISADELMERFVRGESSRNTEGSGLRTINSTKSNKSSKRRL